VPKLPLRFRLLKLIKKIISQQNEDRKKREEPYSEFPAISSIVVMVLLMGFLLMGFPLSD
jgi:hypothetical protein